MNSSQLLYKISNLQYSIRMREAEYKRAMNAGKQLIMDANSTTLAELRTELAASLAEYNSVPATSPVSSSKPIKKLRWWQSLFNTMSTNK